MKLKITVDQKTYEVEVEAAEPEAPAAAPRGYAVEPASVRLPGAPAPLRPCPRAAPVNEEKVCRSPVSGIVVRVLAQRRTEHAGGRHAAGAGSHEDGDQYHRARLPGKIAKVIRSTQGETVQAGQVVVEFE